MRCVLTLYYCSRAVLTKEELGEGLLAPGWGGCASQVQEFGVDFFSREKNK